MIVIGLTGSIAMGKSEVAKICLAEGLPVFDADHEVHALYESKLGAALLDDVAPSATAGGKVDRAELSRLIMADPEILPRIEARIHAEVAQRRQSFLAKAKAQGHSMAVVDVPLLFEKGYDSKVDVTIVVSSPLADQRRRALARPGMTEEKLAMILKRQMPDAQKRERADYIIENNSTLKALAEKTRDLLATIKTKHHA